MSENVPKLRFFEYFGKQTQLNCSLWMIYVRNYNDIMYSKQIKQNNQNLAQYKGSTRSEIGQKWAKMCQNWGFSKFFGHQMWPNSSFWNMYVRTHNIMM